MTNKGLFLFFLLATLLGSLQAQDDDFFLRSEDKEEDQILESSEFANDEDEYIDDVVRRTLIEDNRVLEYAPLEESDVMWERRIWRIIDLRDNRVDTTTTYDPETYEEKIVITESPVNPEDIQRYRVKEVWYFDKKHSVMKVRILGIAPIKDEFDDETGIYKYSFPLFWIYYPKARTFLAKERVPNDFNDITPMSWYQLLEDRFFASYIMKASNSLGLRLEDIHPDSEYDRLLESEIIKQELFNWEHDLWTF